MFKLINSKIFLFISAIILSLNIGAMHKSADAPKKDVKTAVEIESKTKAEHAAASTQQLSAVQLKELLGDPQKFAGHYFLTIKPYAITSVAINKKKTLIAVGDHNGLVRIYELATGKSVTILFNDDPHSRVRCIKFHPTRNEVLVGFGRSDIKEKEKIVKFNHHKVVFKQFIQPLVYFDLDNSKQYILEGHTDWVTNVDFSHDGSMFASISDDCSVRLWDTHSKKSVHVFKNHENYGRSVSFNANSTLLASAAFDGKVNIYDVAKKVLIKSDKVNHNASTKAYGQWLNFTDPAVALFHPCDPNILAVVGTDNKLQLIDVNSWNVTAQKKLGIQNNTTILDRQDMPWIANLAFNADGSRLGCYHNAGPLTTWHIKQDTLSQVKFPLTFHSYGSIAFLDNTLYVGYRRTKQTFAEFLEDGNDGLGGFGFRWNTDINHG